MSITIGQIARRFTAVATTAVALTGLVAAAPASADPNFGAGNLPPMEITEGGTLDYAVSFPACADGYECTLSTYLTSGVATRGADFAAMPANSGFFTSKSGPIVGVQPIPTIDDKQVEGDEALFMNARVDYYKAGCPEGAGRSPSCVPESSMLWKGIVTIKDNDTPFSKQFTRNGAVLSVNRAGKVHAVGSATAVHVTRTVDVPASTQGGFGPQAVENVAADAVKGRPRAALLCGAIALHPRIGGAQDVRDHDVPGQCRRGCDGALRG